MSCLTSQPTLVSTDLKNLEYLEEELTEEELAQKLVPAARRLLVLWLPGQGELWESRES